MFSVWRKVEALPRIVLLMSKQIAFKINNQIIIFFPSDEPDARIFSRISSNPWEAKPVIYTPEGLGKYYTEGQTDFKATSAPKDILCSEHCSQHFFCVWAGSNSRTKQCLGQCFGKIFLDADVA